MSPFTEQKAEIKAAVASHFSDVFGRVFAFFGELVRSTAVFLSTAARW
jgi:hypothetical protein